MASAYALVAALLLAAPPVVIEGNLTAGDDKHPDLEGPMDHHEFETDIRQLLTVTVLPVGGGMDTYLELIGPSGQSYENDDAEGLAGGSKLQIVTPEDGPWEAAVSGYGAETRGRYTLTIETRDLKRILFERGELEDDDQVLLKGGERADVMDLDVKEGKTYVIQLVSAAFDPFLALHLNGDVISNDYVSGLDNAAQLIFTAGADGKAKLVFTTGYDAESRGRYSVRIYEAAEEEKQKPDKKKDPLKDASNAARDAASRVKEAVEAAKNAIE